MASISPARTLPLDSVKQTLVRRAVGRRVWVEPRRHKNQQLCGRVGRVYSTRAIGGFLPINETRSSCPLPSLQSLPHSSPDPRGIYVGVSVGKDQQGSLVLAPSSTLMYGWDQTTKTFYFNVYPYNDCLVHFRIRERNKADQLSHRIHSEGL
jgi:hypothetical protein